MNKIAPIILFVYNRLLHTMQTVDALKKNELAAESDLIIYSDGPKKCNRDKIDEVRSYLKTINGFKSVRIIHRSRNLGLSESIITGVSEITDEYGKAIIVEDDLVTSPYFLRYLNDALNVYEDDCRVFNVHAYMYPIETTPPETLFFRASGCWGWGVWKRSWSFFEKDGEKLLKQLKQRKLLYKFNLEGNYPYSKMLKNQIKQKGASWDIRWYATLMVHNGLSLWPGKSLVKVIGHDGSGTNCHSTNDFAVDLWQEPIFVKKIDVIEDKKTEAAIASFHASIKPSFVSRLKEIILRFSKIN